MKACFLILTTLLISCSAAKPPEEDKASVQNSRKQPELATEVRDEPLQLTPRAISLNSGRSLTLNVPSEFEIKVATEGLKRLRFMAESPDHRLFVTDMLNLSDNSKGTVYILGEFNKDTRKLEAPIAYLADLRNPNSIAFATDQTGASWLYLALTDKLVRYAYKNGDTAPTGTPQVLATYPDQGLSYKNGGWHLTRTVVIGPNNKVYVSVGSSCNVCEEKEDIRATIREMDLDGKHARIIASGLRNAVGLKLVAGSLYATTNGVDHLGDDRPEETMHKIQEGANYGWPYCYQFEGIIHYDDKLAPATKPDCSRTPLAYATFPAHSAPLGLEYFDSTATLPALKNSFLVALHGASKRSIGSGYRIVRVRNGKTEDFITGFVGTERVNGRPADILRVGVDEFLFTDDNAGVIYYIHRK